jgi:hypothetical protein
VDHVSWSVDKWRDADIIIFNAGHWWTEHKIFRQYVHACALFFLLIFKNELKVSVWGGPVHGCAQLARVFMLLD